MYTDILNDMHNMALINVVIGNFMSRTFQRIYNIFIG